MAQHHYMQGFGDAITASQFPPIAAAGAADAPAVAPQNNPAEDSTMHPWILKRKRALSEEQPDVQSLTGIEALLCPPKGMTGKEYRRWYRLAIEQFIKQDLQEIFQLQ